MKISASIFLFLFAIVFTASSQEISVNVKGDTFSEFEEPLTNVYIKIYSKKKRILLSFFNTGNSNSFSRTFTAIVSDTLIISASYTGFGEQAIPAIIHKDSSKISVTFKLNRHIKELEDVIISAAPPMWKRGDTTFFKVDSFKEGNERKLIDIIKKVPGFRISNNGLLTFNNKPVDKILLDGEELFSDKIQLLLQNLPIHVLNTIQALENQSESQVLKGLNSDNKVFVNLTLKKDRKGILFGDLEVGTRSDSKYKGNGTLFSVLKKTSVGLITNAHTVGDGYDQFTLSQWAPLSQKRNTSKVMHLENLYYVFEFPNSMYLSNNLFANQLQFNYNINKKIKIQTEVNYLLDKIEQTTFFQSNIYSNGIYFSRKDSNTVQYRPQLFNLSQRLFFSLDSTSEFKIIFETGIDRSTYVGVSNYFESSREYTLRNRVRNIWNYYNASFSYTKRLSQNNALVVSGEYSQNMLPQNGESKSDFWPVIFSLIDPDYTLMYDKYSNKSVLYTLKIDYYNKLTRNTPVFKVVANKASSDLSNSFLLKKDNTNLQSLSIERFSGRGKYNISDLSGSYSKGFILINRNLFSTLSLGLSQLRQTENQKVFHTFRPLVSISITGRKQYSKFVSDGFDIAYEQKIIPLYRINSIYFPAALTEFYSYKNNNFFQRSLTSSYRLSAFFRGYSSANITVSIIKDFTGIALNPVYSGFFSEHIDSITNKGNLSLIMTPEITFPSIFLNAKIKVGINFIKNNGLILISGSVLKTNFFTNTLFIEIKRNWQKKLFLQINSLVKYSNSKTLSDIGNLKSNFSNLINQISFHYILSSNLSLFSKGQLFQNNIFSNRSASFIFWDLQATHTLKNKRLSLSFKLNNILNEKVFYTLGTNTDIQQSFLSLPLIKRNLYLSIRYEI